MSAPRSIVVLTHTLPEETDAGVRKLIAAAVSAGIEVRLPQTELEKHSIELGDGVVAAGDELSADATVVLGGDGTILGALRDSAARGAPVFAFNFGAIGFLSTVDHGQLDEGIERLIAGDFEVLEMPVLAVETGGQRQIGVNDISFHRRVDGRVAELGYSITGDSLGEVRCDGLVASTPAGSTGYNLANGGPILAWGVEGFIVSFIAPHTLTARSLVVAPDDVLHVVNRSRREDVDVTTDGRTVGSLAPGDEVEIRFEDAQVHLAQVPGANFYHRFKQKFGRLAS